MTHVAFMFEDADLDALLAGPPVEEPVEVAPSEDLRALTRKLVGQYAEVTARFAAQAFAGKGEGAGRVQVRSALQAVARLCESTHDEAILGPVQALTALTAEEPPRKGRTRDRYLHDLRDGLLRFAEVLDAEDADRLRRTVVYDGSSTPLLDELAEIPGIGPRRLERLYCAGLFRIEAVAEASPEEISQVTGLPRPLAAAVVAATLRFAETQRHKVLGELAQRVRELQTMIASSPIAPVDREALVALARASLQELTAAVADLEAPRRKV